MDLVRKLPGIQPLIEILTEVSDRDHQILFIVVNRLKRLIEKLKRRFCRLLILPDGIKIAGVYFYHLKLN